MKQLVIFAVFAVTLTSADVSHILDEYKTTTHPPPPHPYQFEYAAGLFPGHIDRTHAEVSDGTGVVKGAFSYIDPRGQLRSVEYVADQDGFYPNLSHQPKPVEETDAVKLATIRHYQLYNKIAAAHQSPEVVKAGPRDSVAVEKAKVKHFNLYDQIAADHARIGAEREAERLAFEATSERAEEEQYLKK